MEQNTDRAFAVVESRVLAARFAFVLLELFFSSDAKNVPMEIWDLEVKERSLNGRAENCTVSNT